MLSLLGIVPCKSSLISRDIVYILCCLNIILYDYVVIVKKCIALSFHVLQLFVRNVVSKITEPKETTITNESHKRTKNRVIHVDNIFL